MSIRHSRTTLSAAPAATNRPHGDAASASTASSGPRKIFSHRPAARSYLKVFLAKAETDRAHPLRYLGSYLSDQLKLSAVVSN